MDTLGQQMKTVTILLTRYSGLAGRFISGISRYIWEMSWGELF